MLKPRRIAGTRFFSGACAARNSAGAAAIPDVTPTDPGNAGSAASRDRGRNETPMSRNATSHSHRKAFVQWVNGPGKVYASPANGRGQTNYLDGKTHPFPLNPAFQPSPPLARSIKQQIIEDWKAGVGLRQLSTKWGVSLERIDAILKLQSVREKWDTQTMQSYADTMDQVLGTQADEFGDYEPKHNLKIDPGRQIFTLIPEAASYTPEDAAEELGKVPFGQRQEKQIQDFIAKSPFESTSSLSSLLGSKYRSAEVQIQPASEKRADRWAFKIRNTAEKGDTILRKQDGSLIRHQDGRRAQSKWSSSV